MASLVVVEAQTGSLTRYEIGGEAVRKTHACTLRKHVEFTRDIVEGFRTNSPDAFSVEPDPSPTNSPCGAGTIIREAA